VTPAPIPASNGAKSARTALSLPLNTFTRDAPPGPVPTIRSGMVSPFKSPARSSALTDTPPRNDGSKA
jgi:hypothetical protein